MKNSGTAMRNHGYNTIGYSEEWIAKTISDKKNLITSYLASAFGKGVELVDIICVQVQ